MRTRLHHSGVLIAIAPILLVATSFFGVAGCYSPNSPSHLSDVLLISLSDRASVDRQKLENSGIPYSFVVQSGYEPTDLGKPPPGPVIIAATYKMDSIEVFIGWDSNWILFKGEDILRQTQHVYDELTFLVHRGAVTLTESDLREISAVLASVIDWQFGVEIGYTSEGWRQVFPKSPIQSVTEIEAGKLYVLQREGSSTGDSKSPLLVFVLAGLTVVALCACAVVFAEMEKLEAA
jgi:hypothetical protein